MNVSWNHKKKLSTSYFHLSIKSLFVPVKTRHHTKYTLLSYFTIPTFYNKKKCSLWYQTVIPQVQVPFLMNNTYFWVVRTTHHRHTHTYSHIHSDRMKYRRVRSIYMFFFFNVILESDSLFVASFYAIQCSPTPS